MVGNLIKFNHTRLLKVLIQPERWFSCQLCGLSNVYQQKKQIQFKNTNRQLILPALLTYEQGRQTRKYSIGDYDKMWQAVESGKAMREKKRKPAVRLPHGDFLKYGSAAKTFPGFNAPLRAKDPEKWDREDKQQTEKRKKGLDFKNQPWLRGWSSVRWPGRHAGVPQAPNGEEVEGFDSIVIELKRVAKVKGTGKVVRVSALVVVGNKNGSIGWAIGKATLGSAAIRKARNKAVNYLHYVPICDGHTIYHDLRTKVKSTAIKFERRVPGHGIRSQRIVKAICELAGIKDIRCKIVGRTTPLSVVRCTFQGLQMQETHEELAERTGKNVIEYRAEKGNLPVVVACPSEQAVQRRVAREKIYTQEDVTVAFDPYRGVHRPKSLKDIQGTHPDLLAEIEFETGYTAEGSERETSYRRGRNRTI